jgi:SsrA-binding protein
MAAKKGKKDAPSNVLVTNRKARHLYEILDTLEAGIELRGSEVKSLRENGGSIVEAYVEPRGTELFVTGMTIPPYSQASAWTEPTTRPRKLLLHRREIDRLAGQVAQKGMTIVPLRVYLNPRGLVKVEVGLAKGKTHVDKRHDIRERDAKRELAREYKLR